LALLDSLVQNQHQVLLAVLAAAAGTLQVTISQVGVVATRGQLATRVLAVAVVAPPCCY
jgi:hypothetical protein